MVKACTECRSLSTIFRLDTNSSHLSQTLMMVIVCHQNTHCHTVKLESEDLVYVNLQLRLKTSPYCLPFPLESVSVCVCTRVFSQGFIPLQHEAPALQPLSARFFPHHLWNQINLLFLEKKCITLTDYKE